MNWLNRFLYYLGRVVRVTTKVDQIYEDEMKLKKEKEKKEKEKKGKGK